MRLLQPKVEVLPRAIFEDEEEPLGCLVGPIEGDDVRMGGYGLMDRRLAEVSVVSASLSKEARL